ncbi:MAG: hypothetical protein J6C82_07640 [Clostridia bacterium]|nr:hypothetical protein [Clostridia bacterium]
MNSFVIKITGRDFTEFEKAEMSVQKKNGNFLLPCSLDEQEAFSAIKENLIKAFLENIRTKNLYKNHRSRYAEPPMYSVFGQKERFGGFVGVMNTELTVGKSVLVEDKYNEIIAGGDILSVTLTVLSRFDDKNPYFLSMLLSRNDIKLSDNSVPFSSDNLLDYFLWFKFKNQLERAFLKGFFRSYRRIEKNNDRPKGSIDIARHIKLNMGQDNGKIAYSYRLSTEDNCLNHLIIAAYKNINKKYPLLTSDENIRDIIGQLRTLTDASSYSLSELLLKNRNPISHPYYTEYEDLRKTCIMILNNEGISVFDGDEDDASGVLFYIPDLWELFLEDILRRSVRKDARLEKQKAALASQYNVKVFSKGSRGFVQNTYPDFVFTSSDEPFMILDAKFKPGWREALYESGEGLKDRIEDYDKCIRDMNSINAHEAGVIFPMKKSERKMIYEHKISSFNGYDRFYTFPVIIPDTDGKTYYDWKKEFETSLHSAIDMSEGTEVVSVIDAALKALERKKKLSYMIAKISSVDKDAARLLEEMFVKTE